MLVLVYMDIITRNCTFCNKEFTPNTRVQINCSIQCTKNKYYKRKCIELGKSSIFVNEEDFYKTETGIGFKWEKYVADKLGATHLEFNLDGLDIDWNGKLIDVKSAHLNKRKNKRGKPVVGKQLGYWNFKGWGLNEPSFFVCVCVNDDESVEKTLIIPSSLYPKQGITVGQKSKYDIYLI